ncbi:MAG: hypothetical protein KDC44_23260, partial [Phaeodactylibacter sp.]|nr:hypothetical protein [Phaeodactylibacter sp.]
AGTYSGLYLFRVAAEGGLEPVQKISGFNESSRFFEEDQSGRIWVGQFYKGLYELRFDVDHRTTKARRLPGAQEQGIDEQVILTRIDDQLYVATKSGLYRLDQSRDQLVEAEGFAAAIGDQQVYMLKQDRQKNVHVIAEHSVGFFKKISANNYVFRPSSLFRLRYHFNNDLLNISVQTPKGVLYNANEGFLYYRPELEERIPHQQSVLVGSVYSFEEDSLLYAQGPFEQARQLDGPLHVTHRARLLQFKVEAFQFHEVGDQQFRYLLKGFDEDFGAWTTSNTKEYTNLWEGDYEFIVQTRNNFGEIISSRPLTLRVHPPFYRTHLAKVLYLLAGLSVLLVILRVQHRRFSRRTEAVEVAKRRELAAKQQRMTEMEQQQQKTLQAMKTTQMQSELRHLNNLLAASTMNLVVKNEFMETIKEQLKAVRRKGESAETKKALEQIVREIDGTLRLQEDWKQFEHHFDQVHGDFLSRLRDEFL